MEADPRGTRIEQLRIVTTIVCPLGAVNVAPVRVHWIIECRRGYSGVRRDVGNVI